MPNDPQHHLARHGGTHIEDTDALSICNIIPPVPDRGTGPILCGRCGRQVIATPVGDVFLEFCDWICDGCVTVEAPHLVEPLRKLRALAGLPVGRAIPA